MKKNYQVIVAASVFSFCINNFSQAQIISTVAGNNTLGFAGDGNPAVTAELNHPSSVIADGVGNFYIADATNNRVRKVSASGIISTIAGTGTGSFSGDLGAATAAELKTPSGLAIDASGNIYIADTGNNRIRKINGSGIISTVAGNGTPGFSGDGVSATGTSLNQPTGVTIDASGTMYIADYTNNRVRMVVASGIISTIAGTGTSGYSGDGAAATAANLASPTSLCVDASGNIFVADYSNDRIRKINGSGIISTVAGTGTQAYSGDGGQATAAKIALPSGIACDVAGNLYIGDTGNNRVRKVSATGIISTIAGTGVAFYSGDGGAATAARLSEPRGVALSVAGNMYIADQFNNVIRMVTNVAAAGINELSINNEGLLVYPNPTSTILNVELGIQNSASLVEVTDVLGNVLIHNSEFLTHNLTLDVSGLNAGIYFVTVTSGAATSTKKIVVSK